MHFCFFRSKKLHFKKLKISFSLVWSTLRNKGDSFGSILSLTHTVKSRFQTDLDPAVSLKGIFCPQHPRILHLSYEHKNSLCTYKAQKIEAIDYSSPAVQSRKREINKMHDNTRLTKVINLEYHAIKYHLQHNCS